jgi:hypothetical protein
VAVVNKQAEIMGRIAAEFGITPLLPQSHQARSLESDRPFTIAVMGCSQMPK